MALRESFTELMKAAMKAGDKRRTGTLRMITAALKDRDIEARGQGKPPLSDDDILGLLQKMVKQRQESLKIYQDAGRSDLAEQEQGEITIIQSYLPQQMDEGEVSSAIDSVIAEIGAASIKDMGKVMAQVKTVAAGRADMGLVSARIKAKLSG